MTTTLARRVIASALALALLAALLVLSSLNVTRLRPVKAPTVLRDVQLYVPPIPPPSPKPGPSLNRAGGAGALQVKIPQRQVDLALMKLDTRVAVAGAAPAGYGRGDSLGSGLGEGDGGGGGLVVAFDAIQLDSTPLVISAPPIVYPDSLKRRGVRQFKVVFDIIVDEEGRAYPVRIVQSADPDLNDRFMDWAAQVVFTPPLHQGKKVRAEYLWPVLLENKAVR